MNKRNKYEIWYETKNPMLYHVNSALRLTYASHRIIYFQTEFDSTFGWLVYHKSVSHSDKTLIILPKAHDLNEILLLEMPCKWSFVTKSLRNIHGINKVTENNTSSTGEKLPPFKSICSDSSVKWLCSSLCISNECARMNFKVFGSSVSVKIKIFE